MSSAAPDLAGRGPQALMFFRDPKPKKGDMCAEIKTQRPRSQSCKAANVFPGGPGSFPLDSFGPK